MTEATADTPPLVPTRRVGTEARRMGTEAHRAAVQAGRGAPGRNSHATRRNQDAGLRVLILGIGNLLWADEGFGVRALETLAAGWRFGPNVRLLDGGTQGIYLVDQVRAADVLVVFDAVDYGLPPGTLKRVEGAEVPRFMGAKKMSLHQTGFQEVLALADLLGDYPEHLLLIGAQPVELDDFGGSLRPEVKACIAPAITMAIDYLAGLGVTAEPRCGTGTDGDTRLGDLPDPALGIDRYESGRPSAEAACRIGDARVLAALGGA